MYKTKEPAKVVLIPQSKNYTENHTQNQPVIAFWERKQKKNINNI